MSLNDTSRANRIHIGIFGRRNAGKSSLINALTGQDLAIVSDAPGTTANPVFKAMEPHPMDPVVFIDDAGFDDEGELGVLRVEVSHVRGADFPEADGLKAYDLIIHCGACIFNRRLVMSRIAAACRAGVLMINYGIFLAKMNGILDRITLQKRVEKT